MNERELEAHGSYIGSRCFNKQYILRSKQTFSVIILSESLFLQSRAPAHSINAYAADPPLSTRAMAAPASSQMSNGSCRSLLFNDLMFASRSHCASELSLGRMQISTGASLKYTKKFLDALITKEPELLYLHHTRNIHMQAKSASILGRVPPYNRDVIAKAKHIYRNQMNETTTNWIQFLEDFLSQPNRSVTSHYVDYDMTVDNNVLSRFHCLVAESDGEFWVTPLSALNGVFIDDVKVQRGSWKLLTSGAELRFQEKTSDLMIPVYEFQRHAAPSKRKREDTKDDSDMVPSDLATPMHVKCKEDEKDANKAKKNK